MRPQEIKKKSLKNNNQAKEEEGEKPQYYKIKRQESIRSFQ